MPTSNVTINTFNRGIISRYALGRTEVDRVQMSAEGQRNWMPRTLGSMSLRPGLEFFDQMKDNSSGILIPYVEGGDNIAIIELTSGAMRVMSSEVQSYWNLLVGTTLTPMETGATSRFIQRSSWHMKDSTNPNFATNSSGWTDADGVGTSSTWKLATGRFGSTGHMMLAGTRYVLAQREFHTTSTGDAVELLTDSLGLAGIEVSVTRGRVEFEAGYSNTFAAGRRYIKPIILSPGIYHFGFMPAAFGEDSPNRLDVRISAQTEYESAVDYVRRSTKGDMCIPTTWTGAELRYLRYDQIGTEIFVCNSCGGPVKVIKRLTMNNSPDMTTQNSAAKHASWGIADYDPLDGPFGSINTGNKRITPHGVTGNIDVTFDAGIGPEVGELFKITQVGQSITQSFTTANQFSDSIRVSGVENGRKFRIHITNLSTESSGQMRVQRSVGVEGSWNDVEGLTFTSTIDSTHDDGADNQIIYYRIGFGSTDWTATTSTDADATLEFDGGGQEGIFKITGGTVTQASAIVLKQLGTTDPTELWKRSVFNDETGYPTAPAIHEGRLMLAGRGYEVGSVVGDFESFDEDVAGDAGPIVRSLGKGATNIVEWLASLNRLVIGTQDREKQAKTTSFDEPLTPTNHAVRDFSAQGSGQVQAVTIGGRAYFVQTAGRRLYEIAISGNTGDYEVVDKTGLTQEIGEPSIVRMGWQRQPDTRIHCVRDDGVAAILISDPNEDVSGWITVDTGPSTSDGLIEEVCVVPGGVGTGKTDQVFYVVAREVNGSTVRYIERWAEPEETRGDSTTKLVDSWKQYNSSDSTGIVTGATHLIGRTDVYAWTAGSVAVGPYTVSSDGDFTSSACSTSFYYGIHYDALYKSGKLGWAVGEGQGLTAEKTIGSIGLVLADTHIQGLQYGDNTSAMRDLPLGGYSSTVSTDTIFTDYDEKPVILEGSWNTDSRLYLYAEAPKPVTVLAAVMSMDTETH